MSPIINRRPVSLKKKYKRSRQRERILELIKSTDIHPTANWIFRQLKDEFPHLSMGTVYRNLAILAEKEEVKKIDFGSTFDRFEANTTPHYHFVCEKCGRIIDLEMPVDASLNDRVRKQTPHVAHHHTAEFYGVCDLCKVQ